MAKIIGIILGSGATIYAIFAINTGRPPFKIDFWIAVIIIFIATYLIS